MMEGRPEAKATDVDLERRWRAVEAKLAASADRLADQGGLVAMKSASGRRVWVVRYADLVEGRRVHRSVYVGDHGELLRRTQRWLDHCRVRGRAAREVEGYARLAVAASGVVRRLRPGIGSARRGGVGRSSP
jgi:hypothetical protein